MIDAYTIGITLALNNGVADGIAAIRRDLASLDRAVQASAAGLAQLRSLAGGSVAAASADLARLMESARRAAAALPQPNAETPAAEPPPTSRNREPPPEAEAPLAPPAPLRAPGNPAAPPVQPIAVSGPVPAAAQPTLTRTIAPPSPRVGLPSNGATARTKDQPLPPTIVIPAPASPRPVAEPRAEPEAPKRAAEPPAAPGRETMTPPQARTAAPTIDYAALGRAISPQTAPEAAPSPAIRHVEHTRTETSTTIVERETTKQPILIPSDPATPVAPSVPARPVAPPPVVHAAALPSAVTTQPESFPAAPMPRGRAVQEEPRAIALPKAVSSGLPSAARAQPSPAHASTTVEVVLDGAAIGRWMDQRLARAATRPPSGVTGFDPRLSPVWTTVPVAN